jgi:hypothetical protein
MILEISHLNGLDTKKAKLFEKWLNYYYNFIEIKAQQLPITTIITHIKLY